MTEFMSRRERREAEKSGQLPTETPTTETPNQQSKPVLTSTTQAASVVSSESASLASGSAPLSRRELRELERSGASSSQISGTTAGTTAQTTVALSETIAQIDPQAKVAAPEPAIVLPEVSLSSQVSVVERPSFADPVYAAEPSTNSIVLDRIPDAVGVPIEVTGEIITTGSIAILTEPVNTVLTGPLDDRALDSISANDAVTGAITIVEPVSALEVIKSRPNQSVLPERSLRTGWWKPLLLAVATLAMVAAAVAAAFVIINTLGL